MDKLKVGFNIQPLQSGHSTRGMGYYAKNLLKELKKRDDIEIVEFVDQLKQEVDLIHYPYFDFYFHTLPIVKRYRTVVTIPDVTPLIFPNHFPGGIKGNIKFLLQKFSLATVEAVVTISQNSKLDINKYLGVNNEKIFPTYLGVDERFKVIRDKKDSVKKKLNLPDNFALFVGSPNWNKNILNMAEACLVTDLDLVVVGKEFTNTENLEHPEKRSLKQFLEKYSDNPQVHILGFVEDDKLPIIYNLANVLLLPSFYEGFGLPILEAQACGVPVITSDTSSMPEVGGKGALYINPNNVKDLVEAIKKVQDDKVRGSLILKGLDNVKRFSWEKCAGETVEVYKNTQ